jgi:hypothetical protein
MGVDAGTVFRLSLDENNTFDVSFVSMPVVQSSIGPMNADSADGTRVAGVGEASRGFTRGRCGRV